MRSTEILGFVLALSLGLSACHHYRIAPRSVSRGSVIPAATEPHSEVVWSMWWGLSQDSVLPDCQGNGLAEVTTSTHVGFSILYLLTLGVARGSVVEWKCAKDPPSGESDDF